MTNAVEKVGAGIVNQLSAGWSAQVDEGRGFIDALCEWLAGKGVEYALNAAIACVMLLAGWLAIRAISAMARKALAKGMKSRTLLANLVSSIVTKGLWTILIVMVLSRLGVNVGPIIAGLGVTGFILGFAFQESLGNLASGMMIAINEPFKVGDFVEMANLSGTVKEVSIMATVLATGDNKKIVVPNKSAWGGPITNYSALGRRRVDLTVGVSYGTNLAKAVEVAREALKEVPGVLEEPAARVAPISFGDSAITLCVRPWAKASDYWNVHAATIAAIKDAFDRENISIPFPQLDIHEI